MDKANHISKTEVRGSSSAYLFGHGVDLEDRMWVKWPEILVGNCRKATVQLVHTPCCHFIAVCKIDGGAAFGTRARTISCAKLVRLITHEQAVRFARRIYECYSPRRALSIYQDRFAKSVPKTVPCIVYLSRQLLHTAQLITQSKHVVYLSQSVILV